MKDSEVLSAVMLLTEHEKREVIAEWFGSLHRIQAETSDEELLSEPMTDSDPESEISIEELPANFDHLRKK